ncbi:hypothetical protein PRIPAC_74382, partial [Pristionchus pacificus]
GKGGEENRSATFIRLSRYFLDSPPSSALHADSRSIIEKRDTSTMIRMV